MSGDVQPRKRKDKKKKKDELSAVDEPRGTAAVFGDGDIFMHSPDEHGTGGHWCAKIIFFSLLTILIGLIGLIILENRGLSELEANSVQSQYSGVLEGWLEEGFDDDHHDEHTLDLKHHDDDEDSGIDDHLEDEEDENGSEENENEDNEDEEDNDEEDDDEDNQENSQEETENEDERDLGSDDEQEDDHDQEEDDRQPYRKFYNDDDDEDIEEVGNQDTIGDNDIDTDKKQDSYEENDDGFEDGTEEDSNEVGGQDNEDEEGDDDDDDEEPEVEIEKIEKEASDLEPISTELPALPEADDDDDDDKDNGDDDDDDNIPDDDDDDDGDEFLDEADDDEVDDEPPPIIEAITAPPAGKPFIEVDEDDSTEEPPVDTLAEEEEYERRQEELRKEEEEASHMWLKLGVGGALLLATHAVLRRAAAPSDETEEVDDDQMSREETPSPSERRMTLESEPDTAVVISKSETQEMLQQRIQEEIVKHIPSIIQSALTPKQSSEEEEPEEEKEDEEESKDKELYSDEEEVEEDEDVVEEPVVIPKQSTKSQAPALNKREKTPEPETNPEEDEDIPDDVEILDEEQIEEELQDEEEEDEEDISDVDDAELLSRLEAKYGRLPEPERFGAAAQRPSKHAVDQDGGNSAGDDLWPGEPSDPWRQQLDRAERDLHEESWSAAAAAAAAPELASSARARWIAARSLDKMAEARRDNALLSRAITAYLELLKMNERLSDKKLLEVAVRALNRIQFRGNYVTGEPVHRLLIRRFPDNPAYRNNLTISYLMANRADLAEGILKETLKLWPDDKVALAHLGFVLKTQHNKYEEAVKLLQKALEGDTGPANEPRFYYHLGDSLLLLNRFAEAHEVHKRAAALGHFLSPAQRSLYNVDRLTAKPWWNVEDTPYAGLARALERSWKEVLKEGEAAAALYEAEKEGLRERGEWSQLDVFARGREVSGRCRSAPVTCAAVRAEPAAAACRRGQVKFSLLQPGTHVRAHTGPTNCRLRMHLALKNTHNTYLRVDKETKQWQVGKVLLFDDSFEHEVWHNGTAPRLVLIVDVWHPELTPAERRQLPAI